jgi:hypothetical protein
MYATCMYVTSIRHAPLQSAFCLLRARGMEKLRSRSRSPRSPLPDRIVFPPLSCQCKKRCWSLNHPKSRSSRAPRCVFHYGHNGFHLCLNCFHIEWAGRWYPERPEIEQRLLPPGFRPEASQISNMLHVRKPIEKHNGG